MRFRIMALATCAAVLLPARSLTAQHYSTTAYERYDAPTALPGWRGEVGLAAGNALLGGVVTGAVRELRGGSFREGFITGAAGSVVAYSGRRLSVLDVSGAGLLGRELNAVGASMVRNAAAGQPALSLVVLPLGPLRVYLDRREAERAHVRVKLNVHEAYWTLRGALDPGFEFRAAASLSSGAPVFQKASGRLDVGGVDVNGYQAGGSIFLSDEAGLGQHWTLPHETVHVLQSDFLAIAWLDPVEGAVMQQTAATRALYRFLDVGLLDTGVRTALARGLRLRWVNAAQEFEAEWLESR